MLSISGGFDCQFLSGNVKVCSGPAGDRLRVSDDSLFGESRDHQAFVRDCIAIATSAPIKIAGKS
jgi:hypothetical protein